MMYIVGNGFPSGSRILFDGQDRSPFSVTNTMVSMPLRPQDLAKVGAHSVQIVGASGSVSNEFSLRVDYGFPVISSLSTESARLGSSGSKVSVWGRGFTQSTKAEVNGTIRPVTLSFNATPQGGEKRIEFELTAADLAKPGAVSIRLNDSASGLASEEHLVFLSIESALNAAVWDSLSQRFLMAVSPNAIVPVEPATGTRGAPVIVGSDPRVMATSRDGTKLFVALDGERAIARFALPGLTLDAKYQSGPSRVQSIVAAPFINDLIAVNFEDGGVAIFDSNGRRSTSLGPSEGGVAGIQFGSDPAVLYGTNGPILQVMSVVPSGVTLARTLASGTIGNRFVVAEGKAFGTTGRVVDLNSGALVASLPANSGVAIDAQTGFLLSWNRHGLSPQSAPISVYDAKTLQKLGETGPAYPPPTSGSVSRFVAGANTSLSYVAGNALVIGPDL